MAQLTVPIEFDHEDLQEMVKQAKREIAATCITKEQAKNMLTDIQIEIEEIKIDNNVPSGFASVSKTSAFYEGVSASSKVIQQKINELKADQEWKE